MSVRSVGPEEHEVTYGQLLAQVKEQCKCRLALIAQQWLDATGP
jgi:hypothetical protein